MKQAFSTDSSADPILTFGPAHLKRLGAIIRAKRLTSGLSLKAMAEKSKLSVSTVSALEAGNSSPSLNTFVAAISVLGGSIDELVSEVLTETQFRVYRANGNDNLHDTERLTGLSDMQALHISLAPNSVQPTPEPTRTGHSMCMVTEGTVTVRLAEGRKHRLEMGDTYHAQPHVVDKWINAGGEITKMFCVVAGGDGAGPRAAR